MKNKINKNYKKTIFILLGILILGLYSVYAFTNGYTHQNGSEIFYDDDGNIIGIYDNVQYQCRFPTSLEKEENDYLLMSSQEKSLGECLMKKGDNLT